MCSDDTAKIAEDTSVLLLWHSERNSIIPVRFVF